ncbi:MAG: DUF1501 domain-containing protein [Pirellulaceae bacterium]|jgi:hypothetical protein|nr:DUF1501 domain-containing protein [Pirellulaceae bacterium]
MSHNIPAQPAVSRRAAIRAGAIGLMGLGVNHLEAWRARAQSTNAKSCIYIFLSGGLSQHDSFDLKPHAPTDVRGEFQPIATRSPGLQICEHLPMLAQRSDRWSIVRSLTHPFNEHFEGHMVMLTGRTLLPPGFRAGQPTPTDWPSIAAIAGDATTARGKLPPAVALPEILKNPSGRVASGQFAGLMGSRRDPWFVEASPFRGRASSGAFPTHSFNHLKEAFVKTDHLAFEAPHLSLPEGLHPGRLNHRMKLLAQLDNQRRELERFANVSDLDRHRQAAVSLLADRKVQQAFDISQADEKTRERYGQNSFGWSLLMARRLVQAGVNLVQVNLGNWNSWDTHGANFPKLKNFLLPPTDRALSALLDDLSDSGMLDDTLIVMAGEFGRTPKISLLPQHYKLPGRDHWGGAQTAWFAGGGVRGGQVVGSTDKIGAYPEDDPQKPENMAATIYHALGIPPTAAWRDELGRPNHIYHGIPIRQLN